jgi:hypothetical protein
MKNSLIKSPMQYLDQATGTLRDLGITPAQPDFAPINALLEKISDLDRDRIAVISRTLGQIEVFNEVVRDQTQAMEIGNRYEDIAKGFNSIRDDAKMMVDQLSDGKINFVERVSNIWMKLTRGDIADLQVTKSTKDLEREAKILEAYHDFRGALKQSEVLALEVLKKAEAKLDTAKSELQEAAVRAGYGPTIRAGAVVKLVDSITTFQEKSFGIIQEMRKLSTQNSERTAVEDGKRRLEALILEGKTLGGNV